MLKINEFAKLCHCSARTLRYYHEMNVLVPDEIDEESGYRYYKESQAADFYRIKQLQGVGFTIEEIAENQHDQETMLAMFEDKLSNRVKALDTLHELKAELFPQEKDKEPWCNAVPLGTLICISLNSMFKYPKGPKNTKYNATLEFFSDTKPIAQLINQTNNSLVDMGCKYRAFKGFEDCGWKYETYTGFNSLKELYESVRVLPEMKLRRSFHVFMLNESMHATTDEIKQFLEDMSLKGYPEASLNFIFAQNNQCESRYMVLYTTLTLDEAYERKEKTIKEEGFYSICLTSPK